MTTESTYDAIRRLQQRIDCIDAQIQSKRDRLARARYRGPLGRMIEREIEDLMERRNLICDEILSLKHINDKP